MTAITWKGANVHNYHLGRFAKPMAVVIHISDGSSMSCDAWFENPKALVSAHYLVTKTGDIHQFVKEEDTAYHAGAPVKATWKLLTPMNPNAYTIGIEHEGKPDDEWTDAMYKSSSELVADICKRWSIPVDEDHLVMHREIRGDKSCPGNKFDKTKLIALVKGVNSNEPAKQLT